MNYKTPASFKAALEQRLRNSATNWTRKRQILVMERFLVRLLPQFPESLVLKGGLVLELRLDQARSTKDIDLRLNADPTRLLVQIQEAGRQEMGDFLQYRVQTDKVHPEIVADGLPYGGRRFRVEALLANRPYGNPFGLDIALGEPFLGPVDQLKGTELLSFIGIDSPFFPVYPITAHIAEKLHAFTLPRPRPNSRIKDLPDIALLAGIGPLTATELRDALNRCFQLRATHPLPSHLPDPPAGWEQGYADLVAEHDLPWKNLLELLNRLRVFLEPVLVGEQGTWYPSSWEWRQNSVQC